MVDRISIDDIPDPDGVLGRLKDSVPFGSRMSLGSVLHPTEIEAWLTRTSDKTREGVLKHGVREGKPGLPGFVGAAVGRIE